MEPILEPRRLEPLAREYLKPEVISRMWPPEVASKSFIDFLRAQYDHTQLQAIEVSSDATLGYDNGFAGFQHFRKGPKDHPWL